MPKFWWEVYPQGTKEGDEESRFFCALARHPDFKYRSVENLAKESQLSKTRVEDIISKYVPPGMILNNPKDPDQWGYWERIGAKKTDKDLLEEDHENRLKKAKP